MGPLAGRRAIGFACAALVLSIAACGGGAAATGETVSGRLTATSPAAGGTSSTPAASSDAVARATDAVRRADAATSALVRDFWNDGARAFVVAPGGAQAEYWIAAEAFDAVLDGVERTGDPRWKGVAASFIAGQAERGWSRDFFDDENWMALALVRAADLTGDPTALATANTLLDDITANGWDDVAGGVWWDRQHTQKATASNAGPVITAARLYERTGDARRLDFARKAFAHWLAEMVDPVTGQVADHGDPSGAKVWWRFTYNEGTMIGAALALHHATNDPSYLEAAKRIGAFVLSSETAPTSSGIALTDGTRCDGDCEQFKGIAARYLAALAAADPQGGWDALVTSSAEALWDLDRDPSRTTFGVDWAGPATTATVATQSSAAMMLGRAAWLANVHAGSSGTM